MLFKYKSTYFQFVFTKAYKVYNRDLSMSLTKFGITKYPGLYIIYIISGATDHHV